MTPVRSAAFFSSSVRGVPFFASARSVLRSERSTTGIRAMPAKVMRNATKKNGPMLSIPTFWPMNDVPQIMATSKRTRVALSCDLFK